MAPRKRTLLINPSIEEAIAEEPLLKFSFYLSGRTNVLRDVADEVMGLLDDGFTSGSVDGSQVGRASTLVWLWTLGAYEVVRTMTQARGCFSARALCELEQLKAVLSTARMPAAKMEKRGKKQPVTSNRSPDGWDPRNRDLWLGDPESDAAISARKLLEHFERVISSLTPDDVLARHEASSLGK